MTSYMTRLDRSGPTFYRGRRRRPINLFAYLSAPHRVTLIALGVVWLGMASGGVALLNGLGR